MNIYEAKCAEALLRRLGELSAEADARMRALRNATMAARERTGDRAIGTRVKDGQVQVVRVTYALRSHGRSDVLPLSDYGTDADAIAFLDAMPVGGR